MLNALWFVLGAMSIVFAALIALMLVMAVLQRWLEPEARTRDG